MQRELSSAGIAVAGQTSGLPVAGDSVPVAESVGVGDLPHSGSRAKMRPVRLSDSKTLSLFSRFIIMQANDRDFAL